MFAPFSVKSQDSIGSMESVQSTATTAIGMGFSKHVVAITGFITFGVSHSSGKLNVKVVRCIDLAAPRGEGSVADP